MLNLESEVDAMRFPILLNVAEPGTTRTGYGYPRDVLRYDVVDDHLEFVGPVAAEPGKDEAAVGFTRDERVEFTRQEPPRDAVMRQFSLSPDGQRIAYVDRRDDRIKLVDAKGGEPTTLDGERLPWTYHERPCFSPDGRRVLYVRAGVDEDEDQDIATGVLFMVDEQGKRIQLTGSELCVHQVLTPGTV
jgi:hypothetical protein